MNKKTVALMLALTMLMNPALSLAAPTIPGFYGKVSAPAINTLPQPRGTSWNGVDSITTDPSKNQMVINQNKPQATIDWNSFNIGSKATVYFSQKDAQGVAQSTWVALNRIYDKDPSLIFGTLKADGQIYLINQNGILFGPGSQVNVHSLVASALNISNDDFNKGLLRFTSLPAENFQSPGTPFTGDGVIANHGAIETDSGGTVVLLGTTVENNGSINAPLGRISLLSVKPSGSLAFDVDAAGVTVNPYAPGVSGGATTNYRSGVLSAESGLVRLFGATVQHDGIIRSVTTVRQNGKIELRATDSVTTGKDSSITSPVSNSSDTIVTSADNPYRGGGITIGGLNSSSPVGKIELGGAITAPFGTVALNAAGRVYMETGSSIDVSGLWVDKPAGANLIDVQMNSVNLRDDYGQKDGIIKGETVSVNPLYGSKIGGDISGYLTSAEKSARDQSTKGGTIDISAGAGDFILKTGADLNFAGGGFTYAEGNTPGIKLVSGTRVYDLSSAPEWLSYGTILGTQQTSHAKWGAPEEFKGLYLGGGNAVSDRSISYSQGSDAGALSLRAANIVLDGGISGKATAGVFQTVRTTGGADSAVRKLSIAAGLETPLGGTLIIGDPAVSDAVKDHRLEEVALSAEAAPLRSDFTADSLLPQTTTFLATDKLGSAGLSSLSIFSNQSVTIARESALTLDPGSSFSVKSRRIEQNGGITIHNGSVSFELTDNKTSEHRGVALMPSNPDYVPQQERIYLAKGSSIDVSGEHVDNSPASGVSGDRPFNYTAGGSISLTDTRELGREVIADSGAVLDVSGGYGINAKGKITGGDAGTLEMRARTVVLDGDLRGYSLPGNAGGAVIIQAKQVNVVKGGQAALLPDSFGATSDLPAEVSGQATIGDSRFAATGFSRFTLRSLDDLVLPFGTRILPSFVKLAEPLPGGASKEGKSATNAGAYGATYKTLTVDADFVGSSSFTATAGDSLFTGSAFFDPANDPANDPNFNRQRVSIAEGARIDMAPGGNVKLSAPTVSIAGTVNAPAGSISVQSTIGNVTLESTGSLLANGYNRVNSNTIAGLPVGPKPVAAGSVSLTATGGLTLETGSHVDVSGSAPVANLLLSASGAPSAVMVAGDAGKLSLAFGAGLQLDGVINARPSMDGVRGGTLSIVKKGSLTLTAALIEQQQRNGFDALTLGSTDSLVFGEGMTLSLSRSLTLDAPVIVGNGSDAVTLSAPWLRLVNSTLPPSGQPGAGNAMLNLQGDWIDIEGGVHAAGFSDVFLTAEHDLRLSDHFYIANNSWSGKFQTPGNLTIQAGTVYPTTQANFTLSSSKKITILGNGSDPGPVYSVGGNLTIDGGEGIEQRGVVEAPLGRITLQSAANRVYLAEGSITSTAAGTPLYYGTLDANLFWSATPHAVNAVPAEVTAAPDKNVTLTGKEVIVRDGAIVDISGGGGAYSYLFLPGIEGTTDPFAKSGRYVIMPDNSIKLPGDAVYLSGGEGIKAGTYSLLPEQYAFLPGALVITATGNTVAPGEKSLSQEGYPMVGGYFTAQGTNIRSPQLQGFSVRSAADVRKEGHFDVKEFTAGDAGTLKVSGTTTALQGTINSAALNGYRGGTLDLSATRVIVQSEPIDLGSLDFSGSLPASLPGTLRVTDQTVNGKGLAELRLGDGAVTDSVTIAGGSEVNVPSMTLSASKTISVESGAALTARATDGTGSVTLSAPKGSVTIAGNALVSAGSSMTIEANNAVLSDTVRTDHGLTRLISDQVYVVNSAADADIAQFGIYVTRGLWDGVGTSGALTLTGRQGVTFRGDLDLQKLQSLTIDTSRLAGIGQTSSLDIAAAGINLLNSGTIKGVSQISAPTGTVTFSADAIVLGGKSDTVGQGALLMDGFRSITLASGGDLTLMGRGAIKTGWTSSSPGQELILTGARLVTAPYRDDKGAYKRADFAIDGSHGAVSFSRSAGSAGTSTWAGGRLRMTGDSITIAGEIDLPAGEVDLTANGTDGIHLSDAARILSRGVLAPTAETGKSTAYAGGRISLAATNGPVQVDTGAEIDVSAVDGGDAGAINLVAPQGGVTLNGDITGNAATGRGGSLTFDSKTVDIAALNGKLGSGGFTEQLDIRSRQGDLTLGAGETMSARKIVITADGTDGTGNIQLSGAITALPDSDGTGGRVEVHAQNDLTLSANGRIEAVGAAGGEISLGSVKGMVRLDTNAILDVSGESPDRGGIVSFRAQRNTNSDAAAGPVGVNMDLRGQVRGASQVVAEAFQVYSDMDAGMSDTAEYMGMNSATVGDKAQAIRDGLLSNLITPAAWDPAKSPFHFRPGVEVQSLGDLTPAGRDFTGDRYTIADTPIREPGILTLRAAGNLKVNGNLVDQPTPIIDNGAGVVLEESTAKPSWGFNLVAGADLAGADPMAVKAGAGKDLIIDNGTRIYTEKAIIRFSAGHDMTITDNGSLFAQDSPMISEFMSFNLGTYDGAIRGTVGNNLTLDGGVIQSATGNIEITAGGNLTLGFAPGDTSLTGSIRTTGEYTASSPGTFDDNGFPAGFHDYWNYRGGGTIRLQAGRNFTGLLSSADPTTGTTPGWDVVTDANGLHWSANYNNPFFTGNGFTVTTQGVATMGGGNVAVVSGGDVQGQFGAFGAGDLHVVAGGELSGRFLLKNGSAVMTAGGNLAPLSPAILDAAGREITPASGSLFELFHGSIDVAAQGNVTFGTVVNPTIAAGAFASPSSAGSGQLNWNLDPGYMDSSVSLSAANGDLTIIGRSNFYANASAPRLSLLTSVLPPTLDAYAGGSIRLLQQSIALAPSPTGTLRLVAGLDIDGGLLKSDGTFRRGEIYVSDLDPTQVYGSHRDFNVATLFTNVIHALTPVHANDPDNPNLLVAKKGDIGNLKLYLPKVTSISAGRDITDIHMEWQNVNSSDVSSVVAGRNIAFSTLAGSDNIVQLGGPGSLLFMAGDAIDLGTTRGIQEVGNTINPGLPDEKSGLFIAAGASPNLTTQKVAAFFPLLRDAGTEFSDLLAAGETGKAQEVVQEFQAEQVAPLFAGATAGSGRISMISSQISTLGNNGDIFVVAGSDINVGRSAITLNNQAAAQQSKGTGIFTAAGGAINVFTKGDVNVNESRVMTFRGGDITLWSDAGNVNAGRGSKTAVSALPPQSVPQRDGNGNIVGFITVFSPPSVGSGIRAVTYDPDGPVGPLREPPPGDIFAFAPQGAIDAGEAGIAGGRVVLGATSVLNAQNISFSAGSVGVPSASDAGVSLGALAGAGSVAETSKMAAQSSISTATDKQIKQVNVVDQFLSKILDVKVIEFDTDEGNTDKETQDEEKKKKK